jgi:hypothetical protein
VVPGSIVDLEELGEDCPADVPCTYWKARNLRQHGIVVLQAPTAPEVEEK